MKEAHALPGSRTSRSFLLFLQGVPFPFFAPTTSLLLVILQTFKSRQIARFPLIFNYFEMSVSLASTSFFYLKIRYVAFFYFTRCLYIISEDENIFFPHPVTRLVLGKIKENEYN